MSNESLHTSRSLIADIQRSVEKLTDPDAEIRHTVHILMIIIENSLSESDQATENHVEHGTTITDIYQKLDDDYNEFLPILKIHKILTSCEAEGFIKKVPDSNPPMWVQLKMG